MLRLNEFNVGDVWLMSNPCRLVKVLGQETVQVQTRVDNEVRVEERPATRVLATIPTIPIPGLLAVRQAKTNDRYLKRAIQQACESEEGDDTIWQEVWSERFVGGVRVTSDRGAYVDEKLPLVPQLYCHHAEGLRGSRKHTANRTASKGQLGGAKINVPANMMHLFEHSDDPVDMTPIFEPPVGQKAPVDGNQPSVAELQQQIIVLKARQGISVDPVPGWPEKPKRVTIGIVKSLAKSAGVDISDISGAGAMKRILERVRNAETAKREAADKEGRTDLQVSGESGQGEVEEPARGSDSSSVEAPAV